MIDDRDTDHRSSLGGEPTALEHPDPERGDILYGGSTRPPAADRSARPSRPGGGDRSRGPEDGGIHPGGRLRGSVQAHRVRGHGDGTAGFLEVGMRTWKTG